jgi:hypothetical protein
MYEATQPGPARRRMLLPVGLLSAALIALLAFAPLASATPDPVASGSTTITFKSEWTKYLNTFGIKIQKIKPTKWKGQKATFTVTGGEMDPTNGLGKLTLSGGLKFTAGKKSTTVKGLTLNSAQSSLEGTVGGKKMKFAKLSGLSFTRAGFGVNVSLKKLQLTNSAANQLNKKLGYSKGKPKPFLKNKQIGSSKSEDQPKTVTLLPANSLIFEANSGLLSKLSNVKASVETISPTTGGGTSFSGPINGGTLSPTATAGTVMSGLGLKLVQKLPTSATTSLDTTITLGSMYLDLTAKTVTVEVIAESNAESPAGSGKKPLNLGNLGRSSIADLTVTGVTADPTTRQINVNSSAVLQPVSAEVLQGFVSVYKAYIEGVTLKLGCEALPGKCLVVPAEKEGVEKVAKEKGDEVAKNEIKSGEALGSFRFTAQGQ